MKTQKEIEEYLKDKWLNNHTGWLIEGYLKAKNICNSISEIYSLNNQKIDCSFKDFLEWFENETKDNQDIITFKNKEYEFIEDKFSNCCDKCDIREEIDINYFRCNLIPYICTPSNRIDKREGYFRLKTTKEKEQPKELELIPHEFYSCIDSFNTKWVFQKKQGNKKTSCYFCLALDSNCIYGNGHISHDKKISQIRLATTEEKQELINRVEAQENKLWNEETKTFKDKPKDILVPENIKITDCKTDGYTLGLLFNNDIQILTYGKKSKAYLVGIKGLNAKYIQCKLIPTLFADIKAGDIYIECGLNQLNPSCYHIKLQGKEYVKIDGKKDIQVNSDLPDKNQNVLKVVPII